MSEQAPDAPAKSGEPPQSMPLYRVVLFSVLVIVALACAYDFLYARPQSEQAWERMQVLVEEKNTSGADDPRTSEDVQKLLNRQPDEELVNKENYYEEFYRWRAGLPWKSYYIHVTYLKTDPPLLHSANINAPVTDLPGRKRDYQPATGDAATDEEGATDEDGAAMTGADASGDAEASEGGRKERRRDRKRPPAESEAENANDAASNEAEQAEPKEAESKEAEPKEAESKEAESKETEPKGAEPKEAEPKEAEPKEVQVKEVQSEEAPAKEVESEESNADAETEPSEVKQDSSESSADVDES